MNGGERGKVFIMRLVTVLHNSAAQRLHNLFVLCCTTLLYNGFSACNDSTSTFAERTIYDRLYFFHSIYDGAEDDLKATARNGRARDVQIKDLKVYYLKVND